MKTGLFAQAADGQTRVPAARTPATLAALDQMADLQKLKDMSGHAIEIVERLFDPERFLSGLLAERMIRLAEKGENMVLYRHK